jgi:hypothetical protein
MLIFLFSGAKLQIIGQNTKKKQKKFPAEPNLRGIMISECSLRITA